MGRRPERQRGEKIKVVQLMANHLLQEPHVEPMTRCTTFHGDYDFHHFTLVTWKDEGVITEGAGL